MHWEVVKTADFFLKQLFGTRGKLLDTETFTRGIYLSFGGKNVFSHLKTAFAQG